MTNASLSDVALLAVEIRQLRERVAALEAQTPRRRAAPIPELNQRILEIAAKRKVITCRDVLHIERGLDGYEAPRNAVWMAIYREVKRGTMRRVGRGKYTVNPPPEAAARPAEARQRAATPNDHREQTQATLSRNTHVTSSP